MRKIEIDSTGELRDHETKVPIACPRISGQLNTLPCRTACAFYNREDWEEKAKPSMVRCFCKEHCIGWVSTEHGD